MGCRSITHFTVYRYFARAKRKETQHDWAVITLEVDAVLGRVQIAVHWLTSFVCDKGQVQCLMTPFIMRNSETMFICTLQQVLELVYSDTWQQHLIAVSVYFVYLQITSYLTSRALQRARHEVILYCIVLYSLKN